MEGLTAERLRSMEADLVRIDGVQAARIEAEAGAITEVHVLADSIRRPKGVARDVMTMLLTRHGVRVSHQKISVAGAAPPVRSEEVIAAAEGFAVESPPTAPWRIRVGAVELSREGDVLRARVELREGERRIEATEEMLATSGNHVRVVASAALEAVRVLTSGLVPLFLEDARPARIGRLPVVLVHVVHLRPSGEHSLVGCSAAREGRLEAAVRAVLDAVNRILEPYRPRDSEVEYDVTDDGRE